MQLFKVKKRFVVRAGIEPTTSKLTASCSTIELPSQNVFITQYKAHSDIFPH